jgi:hypothetical protein
MDFVWEYAEEGRFENAMEHHFLALSYLDEFTELIHSDIDLWKTYYSLINGTYNG